MCRFHPAAEIVDPDHAATSDDDWFALWAALIALELDGFEATAVG